MGLIAATRNLRQRRKQMLMEQIGIFDLRDVTNVGHHIGCGTVDQCVEGLAYVQW